MNRLSKLSLEDLAEIENNLKTLAKTKSQRTQDSYKIAYQVKYDNHRSLRRIRHQIQYYLNDICKYHLEGRA